MTSSRRRIWRALLVLAGFVGLIAGATFFPWPIPAAPSFELVAHRGVHQTHPGREAGVTNETCTAKMIDPPTHGYIENTIPSMRAALAAGATAVEIDIHRTADDQLIVFHDWTLDCRTDGTGVTNEQTTAVLKRLDIGYGYTADGGQTFPLRGAGVGLMNTLPDILAVFPSETFIIHDKDGDAETSRLLARAHQAGARVFITDVDTPEQLAPIAHLPLDGMQTSRIEVIGPLLAERTHETS